ncbi:hypothetical protein [Clostridium pasteurianum]|uniref:Uncharacterized protein n=1 Tax=Clostridium pasteurianum BC1 TaxID=86416 RepID=R4K3E0_CLOPA|nr:hypothetical protein [Clostridium pasteurianum]AGK97647.1 hypothetical protein Clopa_2809 [Clostridium pasteurianum BC1]
MFNFIKLPNKLFYSIDNDSKSILQEVKNDKVILILDYLYNCVDRKDIIRFTLEDVIVSCGFKPNTNVGKSNEQFRNILIKLQDLHIISFSEGIDIKTVKPKNLIKCEFNKYIETKVDKETGEIKDSFYIQLSDQDKDKIMNYAKEKVDTLKLLIYYCYLKARIYKRPSGDLGLAASGGRSETCFLKYNRITEDLGIVDKSIKKYNDILIELNLIRIKNPGLWYYLGDELINKRESPNFFTLYFSDKDYARHNLNEAIKSWKGMDINKNKIFLDTREYKNNNRSLNGKIGRIIRKENEGTATEEDLALKEKILNSMNPNLEREKLESILDANLGESLYNIYDDKLNDSDKAEYYEDIENKLGLYDDDTNTLTVDWKYYRWVMVDYQFGDLNGDHKGDIEYFKNCVTKKIRENSSKPKEIIENKVDKNISYEDTMKIVDDDIADDNSYIETLAKEHDEAYAKKKKAFGGFYDNITLFEEQRQRPKF